MNNMQLKAKLKNVSKERNISFNILLRTYMYERFIERLSVSDYRDNFILKGGFYLSNFLGVDKRYTMDIDASFKNLPFTKDNVVAMVKEIISIHLDDNARFRFLNILPIRDEDEYGGYRVVIEVNIQNIKDQFHFDIATGDIITPKEIEYHYKTILNDKNIKVWAYNIETVLAEKLETIFSRGELNGRMKDFYDIYLIYIMKWSNINFGYLKQAIHETFLKRKYEGDWAITFDFIKKSSLLNERWRRYLRKNKDMEEIEFDDVLNCIKIIMEHMNL